MLIKKAMLLALTAVALIVNNTVFGGTTEVLQKRLDAAIAASDWGTAEAVSKIMANVSTAKAAEEQAEFFRQNNDAVKGIMNVYKAAPRLLELARTLVPAEAGTEEHLFLHTIAPAAIKLVQTGQLDVEAIHKQVMAFQKAEKERVEARERKWAEARKARIEKMRTEKGGKRP